MERRASRGGRKGAQGLAGVQGVQGVQGVEGVQGRGARSQELGSRMHAGEFEYRRIQHPLGFHPLDYLKSRFAAESYGARFGSNAF